MRFRAVLSHSKSMQARFAPLDSLANWLEFSHKLFSYRTLTLYLKKRITCKCFRENQSHIPYQFRTSSPTKSQQRFQITATARSTLGTRVKLSPRRTGCPVTTHSGRGKVFLCHSASNMNVKIDPKPRFLLFLFTSMS